MIDEPVSERSETLALLKNHPMLTLLPDQSLDVVVRTGRRVSYRSGRMVIREGDEPSAFCLLSGSTRVFHRSGQQEVTVKLFKGPALGGEMEVLCNRPYLVHMCTLEASDILHIRADVFKALVSKHLSFAAALSEDLSARLFIATSNERAFAFSDVATRLADLLLDYASLCGAVEDQGIRLTLPLTQTSLGRDLAVSRKSLLRALADLKDSGIVVKDRARYIIQKPRDLALAGTRGLAMFYRLSDTLKTHSEAAHIAVDVVEQPEPTGTFADADPTLEMSP